jgi:phosphoglycerate dehydrogenase-like enzyme
VTPDGGAGPPPRQEDDVAAGRVRVVAATALSRELADRITAAEPRVDLVLVEELLRPQRFPGDRVGDPDFSRDPQQQTAFEALLDSAEVLYGIPDDRPSALRRTVQANPGLRWVHGMAAGAGSSVRAAKLAPQDLQRVAFTTSAGVHTGPLAEFCVFGVLAGAKQLPRLQELQARHEWPDKWFLGRVAGSTVLLVGLGEIGRATARQFQALGATVIGTSRSQTSVQHVDRVIHPDEIVDVVGDVDAIVISLPGTHATDRMIGASVLAAVKSGVTVVNVGRGTVVDEDALVEALRDGRVGFAALDVVAREPLAADSPLWDLPNVLISPHTAAQSPLEDELIADLFARNATRYLDGQELVNRVDTVEFY